MSSISQSDQQQGYENKPVQAYPDRLPVTPGISQDRPEEMTHEAYPDVPQSFVQRDGEWESFREEERSVSDASLNPYSFSYQQGPPQTEPAGEAVPEPEKPEAPEDEAADEQADTAGPAEETAAEPDRAAESAVLPAMVSISTAEFDFSLDEMLSDEAFAASQPAPKPAAAEGPQIPAFIRPKEPAAPAAVQPAGSGASQEDPVLAETRRLLAEQKARRTASFAPLVGGDDDDYRYDASPVRERSAASGPAIRVAPSGRQKELSNPLVRDLSDEDAADALKATVAADLARHSAPNRTISSKPTFKPAANARKSKKPTKSSRIMTALLILFSFIFVFSLILLILNLYPRMKARSEYIDLTPEKLIKDGTVTVDFDQQQEEDSIAPVITREMLDYYISVNSDFIGWLDVPDTNIHYPVVHGKDNDYYLRHTFRKEYSDYGAIFADKDNSTDFKDDNTVLYGHNMRSGAMFHDLNTMHTNADFAKEHMTFTITTRNGRILTYQIFSIYRVNIATDYRTPNIANSQDRIRYFERLKSYSAIDFGPVTFDADSKIVTFSTCPPDSADDWRVAVHALLIDTGHI